MEPKARGHRFPKGDKERSTSGALTRAMISWVRDTLGEPGVRQLLAVAGLSRPLRELEDETGWVAYRESGLLLDAAIAVSGRPDASRRIGEEVVRGMMSTEVGALLRSLGSPSEVIRNVVASGVKFSAAVGLEVLHVEECHAVLCSRTLLSAPREKKECDFMSGIFSMVPVIFGMDPAEVWETECQRWGDSRCVYNMAWKVDSGIANDPLRRIAHLEVELIDLNKRFESLQSMATELVSADDIEEVLTLVMRRAGVAVRASRYLLAVQLGSKLSIHSDGFTADEAEILAGEVLAGEPDDHGGSRLIVDVASRGRHYGRLAAVFPTGGSFFPQERDLLSAYAGHAAAVLDTATALEEVRRQNRTSAALLALAHDLSEATTSHEVATRLVEAVTKVVDCDSAGVLLWNIQEGRLRLAANVDMPESAVEILSGPGIGVEDTEAMARMLDHPEPSFYDYESADDYHRQFITPGRSSLAIVPIVWGGTFFGVVVAGIHRPLVEIRQDGEVVERLSGIAHQAGTALENAALLDQIRHQALHDSLTGLPNRVLLHDRARQALLDTDRTYDRVALAFLDVDRFKKINDTLGHRGGDELLIQVGRRLGQGLRASDTVVRLGGDEFVVLMPHVRQAADAFALAEKIAESMAASFTVGGLEIFVTVSMGVSVSGEGGGGYEDLLKQADVAMYQAKALGGGHIHVYEESKDALTGDDLALECELHSAVTGGELRVVYQTQVDLSTGGVVGVEALVRWEHPTRGMLEPADFLAVAEESDLIVDVDLWVLDQACAQAVAWSGSFGHEFKVAVNLSSRTAHSPRLEPAVAHVLESCGLDPGALELEITERVVDTGSACLPEIVKRLRARGIGVAIDDFGTGSSSFGRVQGIRVDTLKIDRSLVVDLTMDPQVAPLLSAMIDMGAALGLRVVAEGVEVSEQADWLRSNGCATAQGFLFSRPTTPDEIESGWLTSNYDMARP